MCVCVRACVRACVHACVRARVCVCVCLFFLYVRDDTIISRKRMHYIFCILYMFDAGRKSCVYSLIHRGTSPKRPRQRAVTTFFCCLFFVLLLFSSVIVFVCLFVVVVVFPSQPALVIAIYWQKSDLKYN